MAARTKIAVIQTNPKLMETKDNLKHALKLVKEAANEKANLIVLPECSLSGYVFHSRDEVMPLAEIIPGPSTEGFISLCEQFEVYIVLGLVEVENNKLFNVAALLSPQGVIGKYRKTHIPFLGLDRFVDKGSAFKVHETPIGNIGLQICYDIEFPESSRVMALMGADILVHISNSPTTEFDRRIINHVVISRAIENTVYVVTANRVGTERGWTFCGLSKIVDTSGKILNCASPDKEEIIYSEVSPESARQKQLIVTPGEYEQNYMKDRRPELYGPITKSP